MADEGPRGTSVDDSDNSEGVAGFAAIARTLAAEPNVDEMLSHVCRLAEEHIEPCDFAGISLVQGRRVTSRGTNSEVPRRVDDLQHETGEGPCLEAIRESDVCESPDLSYEDRWPRFAKRAVEETGVHAILSFRLFLEGDTMGALNLYSIRPHAFDDDLVALEWGSVFAAHAAVALRSALKSEQLDHALESRSTIGVALGILMGRQGISREEAFDVLRRASQRLNVKLRTVATQIAGGELTDEEVAKLDDEAR